MITASAIVEIADAYKVAAGVERDTTVSHRVFRDSKKLASLRANGDLTLRRFNEAIDWFQGNWPEGAEMPSLLNDIAAGGTEANGEGEAA